MLGAFGPFQFLTLQTLFMLACSLHGAPPFQDVPRQAGVLLAEIMELHLKLADREEFRAQARLLGVYLDEAKAADDLGKARMYATVLAIMQKIQSSSPVPSANSSPQSSTPTKAGGTTTAAAEPSDSSVFESGAALLEVFNANSFDNLPSVPGLRSLWKRDLCKEDNRFIVPGREGEVSESHVDRLSFYLKVDEEGDYGFTLQVGEEVGHTKGGRFVIGGRSVVQAGCKESRQGIIRLAPGFHRCELLTQGNWDYSVAFGVTMLAPGGFDSKPITKDMLLLKSTPKSK